MILNKIPVSLYVLLLLGVLILGMKKAKKGEFHEDFLSLDVTKGLQGFAAVGIMLHHLVQDITDFGDIIKGYITLFNFFGVLFTAVFFFCSGYGLYTSLQKKPDYLHHFFRKRLTSILVPFYTANTIFFLFSLPSLPDNTTALEYIAYITGFIMLNSNLWFIVEIAFLYIAFYLIFKYIKNEKAALISMAAFIFVLVGLTLLNGHDYTSISGGLWFKGEWWYNTTWTFFLGIMVSRFQKPIIDTIKKHYPIWLVGSIILHLVMLPVSCLLIDMFGYYCESENYPGYLEKLFSMIGQFLYAETFVIMLLIITMKLQFKNRILSFLGKISIELYLIHRMYIILFSDIIGIQSDFLFFFCVYACAIVTAVILHFLDGKIISAIKGKSTAPASL